MPVAVSYAPLFALLTAVLAILLLFLVIQIRRLRSGTTRKLVAVILGAGIAAAGVAGLLAYGLYTSYVRDNTWTFSYYVDIQTKGTRPDAIVVPSVAAESLLAGLALNSGMANWSFVETVRGRGLYIAFTGNASISRYLSQYPPPNPVPNTSMTMTNGTDGPPEIWVYHEGSADVSLSFYVNSVGNGLMALAPGWSVHLVAYPPVAA